MNRRRRVTAHDVARAAGVSQATVSYVLNDAPDRSISDATKQQVLDAVEDLGYTPFAPARALRTGRTDIVLFVLPDWPIGFAAGRIITELTRILADHGLTLVTHQHQARTRAIQEVCEAVGPVAVLGGLGILDHDDVTRMRRAGIVVSSDLFPETGEPPRHVRLHLDQGRAQAEHLLARGHRRLGYAWTANRSLRLIADGRLTAVRSTCRSAGLDDPIVVDVDVDLASAGDAVTAWREAGVTGVCAFEDLEAMTLLGALRQAGLSAPDDLAVIGVDDNPLAKTASPPLSTVSADLSLLALRLAAPVVQEITEEKLLGVPGEVPIETVPRGST